MPMTLFTFDSFSGLQRMFSTTADAFTAEDFRDYRAVNRRPYGWITKTAPSPRYNYSISVFDSWAERLNVPPGPQRRVYECDGGNLCPVAGCGLAAQRCRARSEWASSPTALPRCSRLVWSGQVCDHFARSRLLIISEQVGVAKPDARIFDYALAQAVTHRAHSAG